MSTVFFKSLKLASLYDVWFLSHFANSVYLQKVEISHFPPHSYTLKFWNGLTQNKYSLKRLGLFFTNNRR